MTGATFLLRDERGSSGVQALILTVSLALAGAAGMKILAGAVASRGQCAGEQIEALAGGAVPCRDTGEGGNGGDAALPQPPAEDPGAGEEPSEQPTQTAPEETGRGDEEADDEKGDGGEDGGEGEGAEEPDPLEELLAILADIIGVNDAVKCVTEGDIVACLMTVASAAGFFKAPLVIAKLLTRLPSIVKAIKRLITVGRKSKKPRKKPEPAKPEPKCQGSRCKKPDKCFAPGTPVHTERGLVAIEELQVGDLVWSRDDETGAEGYRPIERIFVTPDRPLLRVTLEDSRGASESLSVTTPHPFRTGRGWVAAGDLRAGDEVASSSGVSLRVVAVDPTEERSTVYNFEVAEYHTYFVGEAAAWVHNDCPDELPEVKKAVNSNLPHAADRAVERGIFASKEEASKALRDLSKQIKRDGRFPEGTIKDAAHPDRVLVPIGNGGMAAYQIAANGTAKLKTVLIAR